jgi:iron complex outermembrane receptor protein
MNTKFSYITLACLAALNTQVKAAETADLGDSDVEKIQVIGKSVSYANNETTESMLKQQSNLTSVLASIDNLPGVLINEGDTFGSDDWSTTISIRGFQVSLDEQQIGITVDGIANGNSNYGGGAKANRYIDTENLYLVEVSQGTADIASRSNEALGGTLNFTTIDPTQEEGFLTSLSFGDFQAQKYFLRYNTGEIARDTFAWISVSSSSNTDWVNQSAENKKDHLAAKLISDLNDNWGLTAYASYDDSHEDNYQRVSKAQFETNPDSDRLTSEWTGVPYVDQLYRKGWSTLRENFFAYVALDYAGDNLNFSSNVYYHDNEGRGDWVPPYLNDLTDDTGRAETELSSQTTAMGGSSRGIITFVNRDGLALTPADGCVSSITFPYGGAGSAFDADCFGPEAIPVGSYRHTHYGKQRFGLNADIAYTIQTGSLENSTRAGLWYEDYSRDEYRDWHKIIDSASSFEFDNTPYWIQYDNSFAVDTTMLYIENETSFDWIKARIGAKKFIVELSKDDNFNAANNVDNVNSDSDVLISAGLVANMPFDGLEVFAGYAENFAAIKDTVLERDSSTLTEIKPETATNFDIGFRYNSDVIDASVTFYKIDFDNRVTFLPPDSPVSGIDYNIGTNGSYINVGGIESEGIEASVSVQLSDYFSFYGSFTSNESTYKDVPDELGLNIQVGNTVFGSVEDMWVTSLDYNKGNYSAGLSVKYVGDRFIDAANTVVAEAYTVTDLYAGVNVDLEVQGIQNMQVRFTLNNLTDESYLSGIAGQSAWIGAPRTAAVNLQFSF